MRSIYHKFSTIFEGDKLLWGIATIVLFTSVMVVYSSTGSLAYSSGVDPSYYLNKQLMYNMLGFISIFVIHKIDYSNYKDLNGIIFFVGLLMVVMLEPFGVEINGEKRWLGVPFTSLTFMPTDFLKIGLIMILASQISKREKIIGKLEIIPPLTGWTRESERYKRILIYTSVPLLLPALLATIFTMIRSLSTAMILAVSALIMLVIGGVRLKQLCRLMGIASLAFVFMLLYMIVTNNDRVYIWKNRVTSAVDSRPLLDIDPSEMDGAQFQKYQSRIAIASGKLIGKGPGNSTQRSHLPLSYSDYVFAFIVEEYGLLGAIFTIFLYLGIMFRSMAIFRKCDSTYTKLIVLGISSTITLQSIFHIAVSSGVAILVTGQTLPIMSSGGSSVVFTSIMLGMILGISRQMNEKQRDRKAMENLEFIEDNNLIEIKETSIRKSEKADIARDTHGEIDDLGCFSDEIGVVWNYKKDDEESEQQHSGTV